MLQQLQVKRRTKRNTEGFSLLTTAFDVSLVMNVADVDLPKAGATLFVCVYVSATVQQNLWMFLLLIHSHYLKNDFLLPVADSCDRPTQ